MIAGLFFAGGLLAVVAGAEILVASASALARRAGVSALMIGLTVVAFGTSAPEVAISAASAVEGHVDTGLGNIVGSNIFNLMFIPGLIALFKPLIARRRLFYVDAPVLVAVSVLTMLLAFDGDFGRWDGLFLLVILVAWSIFAIVSSRRGRGPRVGDSHGPDKIFARLGGSGAAGQIIWLVVSLVLLGLGSHWLVAGGTEIARAFGVSEFFIGLTMIAVGTSLPEVAASLAAFRQGEQDMAVGNVIGSSIINIVLVLPVLALLSPEGISVSLEVRNFDIPMMVVATVLCLLVLLSGFRISRWEGAVLLGWYAAYMTLMALNDISGYVVVSFGQGLLMFVVPLILVTAPSATGAFKGRFK